MEKLSFSPEKSAKDFRKNYRLHDLAEEVGKSLLTQWGIDFQNFGQDKRYEKVWEKGKDKPDVLITYMGKKALIDWKGKQKSAWLVNKRAVDSYIEWSKKLNIPMIICFFVFDGTGELKKRAFAFFGKHNYIESKKKQWDKNITVEFEGELPEFTKSNLLKYLRR